MSKFKRKPKATVADLEVVVLAQDKQIEWLTDEVTSQFHEIGLLLKLVNELAGVVKEAMCQYHPEYKDASKRPPVECDFCEQQHDDYIEHVQVVAEEVTVSLAPAIEPEPKPPNAIDRWISGLGVRGNAKR
jgi:hypothetical protein